MKFRYSFLTPKITYPFGLEEGFCTYHIFVKPFLNSVGMGHVINEMRNKKTILQRNYRKMTMKYSFFYYFFVKFHGKIVGSHTMTVISIFVL